MIALGDLGLRREEFEEMMLCDFVIMLHAHDKKKENEWRHTRAILGALTGKDPRFIYPIDGDWDHLEITPPKDRIAIAEKLGMKLTDEFKKNMLKAHGRS